LENNAKQTYMGMWNYLELVPITMFKVVLIKNTHFDFENGELETLPSD